jgi:hypothetical protein
MTAAVTTLHTHRRHVRPKKRRLRAESLVWRVRALGRVYRWLTGPDRSRGDWTLHGLGIVSGEWVPGSPRTTAVPAAVLPSAGCSTLPGYAAHEMV